MRRSGKAVLASSSSGLLLPLCCLSGLSALHTFCCTKGDTAAEPPPPGCFRLHRRRCQGLVRRERRVGCDALLREYF